ncbi:MAG: exopolyphosphatase [Spirochaetaceae bacterium]
MEEVDGHFRLVTQQDFDGLVCAALLHNLGLLADVRFVHPREMEEGLIPVGHRDIVADLPYVEGVHLVFNHMFGEQLRVGARKNHVIDPTACSASRVLYNFYGGPAVFPEISEELLAAADKGDAADFTTDEVLHPRRWVLLIFLLDQRTGLGRFRNFRVSTQELMRMLVEHINRYKIDDLLRLPDVAERVDLYFRHQEPFKRQVRENAKLDGNVLLLDLRHLEPVYAGNRFVKYALFPEADISIRVMWGFERRSTVINVGKSIFNRSSPVNVGSLMRRFGGGGHESAGACQVDNDRAETVIAELLSRVREDGP